MYYRLTVPTPLPPSCVHSHQNQQLSAFLSIAPRFSHSPHGPGPLHTAQLQSRSLSSLTLTYYATPALFHLVRANTGHRHPPAATTTTPPRAPLHTRPPPPPYNRPNNNRPPSSNSSSLHRCRGPIARSRFEGRHRPPAGRRLPSIAPSAWSSWRLLLWWRPDTRTIVCASSGGLPRGTERAPLRGCG